MNVQIVFTFFEVRISEVSWFKISGENVRSLTSYSVNDLY